jgi:proline utilization trans-activator
MSSAIYSQNSDSEASFISNVQNILYSLHEVESTIPAEHSMGFCKSGLLVAGWPFNDSSPQTSRTSSSLYLSIYQVRNRQGFNS